MKRRKTYYAGPLVLSADYPARSRGDSPKTRAAKTKASTEAQRRFNQIASQQELELRLAANFPRAGSGLVVTLTYDDKHLPSSRKQALRQFKYFLKRLREERKRLGLPAPRVIYAPEVLTSESGRWHFHLVMDNTGDDLPTLRRCWIYGSDIECVKLRVDAEKDHASQARYMSKEMREAQEYECRPGLHGWSCTRNCLKPEVDVQLVEDAEPLEPPKGAAVLLFERRETDFAGYVILKYRYDGSAFPAPRRARRRRRRAL